MVLRKRVFVWLVVVSVVVALVPVALAEEPAKININSATVDELLQLQQIGPQKARRIVEYREKNGSFEQIEDIIKVKGIGQKTFELNKDRIAVE